MKTMRTITMLDQRGDPHEVEPREIHDGLAIVRPLCGAHKRWCITHVQSGCLLAFTALECGRLRTLADARIAVAALLASGCGWKADPSSVPGAIVRWREAVGVAAKVVVTMRGEDD